MARGKYNRKKNYKKKSNTRIVRVPRTLGPIFPQAMVCKHRFVHDQQLTTSYTSGDQITGDNFERFRCWNIYDPLIGIGGTNNAMFYDDMTPHYDKYQVLGARIKVRFINLSEEPCYAGLFRDDNSISTGWTMQQIREKGKRNQRILGPMSS